MKKNNMMRIASVLLVAVLLTSCVIAGTFAKYTSSNNGTDNARVAYWGWTPAELTIDLFNDVYSTDVDSTGDNGDNVVAPGTAKTSTFAFAYTPYAADPANALTAGNIAAPEVDYSFVIDAEITGDYDALDANPNFVWTLQGPDDDDATEYQTVAAFIAAIEALDGDETFDAGELPEGFSAADEVYTIGWAWAFETAGAGMAAQDVTDTTMGNATDLDDVTFNIVITATQINA